MLDRKIDSDSPHDGKQPLGVSSYLTSADPLFLLDLSVANAANSTSIFNRRIEFGPRDSSLIGRSKGRVLQ